MKVTRRTQEAWVRERDAWPGTFKEWLENRREKRHAEEKRRAEAVAALPGVQRFRRAFEQYVMTGRWPELPHIGVDHGNGPDTSGAVLLNVETGEFTTLDGGHGFVSMDPPQTNTIGDLSKATYDPTWMDEMPVFEMGRGFTTFGEMRKREP